MNPPTQAPLPRLLLALAALGFAVFGAWGLLDPVGMLAAVQVAPQGPTGVVELRAMYGGVELGAALFLALCAADPARVRLGLLAAVCLYGGLGVVRAASAVAAGPVDPLIWIMVGVELVSAGLCGIALRTR